MAHVNHTSGDVRCYVLKSYVDASLCNVHLNQYGRSIRITMKDPYLHFYPLVNSRPKVAGWFSSSNLSFSPLSCLMDEMYSPPPLSHMPLSEETASEPLMLKRLKARLKCVGHLPIPRLGKGGRGQGRKTMGFSVCDL